MVDRYTKVVLTVIALCLVVLTASVLFPTAEAQSAPQPQPAVQGQVTAQAQSTPPKKRCVWTVVGEHTMNKLGVNGEIKLGTELQSMSEKGWELKATYQPGSSLGGKSVFNAFVFERCEEK